MNGDFLDLFGRQARDIHRVAECFADVQGNDRFGAFFNRLVVNIDKRVNPGHSSCRMLVKIGQSSVKLLARHIHAIQKTFFADVDVERNNPYTVLFNR